MRTAARVLSFLLVLALPVRAQDVVLPAVPALELDEPDVGKALSPMKRGQRAPFTGVLLSPAAAADLTLRLEQEGKRTELAVTREVGLANAGWQHRLDMLKATLDADKAILQARLDGERTVSKALTKRVGQLEAAAGGELLWLGLGAGGGVLVTLGAVFVASKALR